ncbi:MAG TPA: tetratricopeptide repeat protein [Azospirillaceae bacterium]|nr:tetratricopeptide repeat protein [Azospirillaceae bacterium]
MPSLPTDAGRRAVLNALTLLNQGRNGDALAACDQAMRDGLSEPALLMQTQQIYLHLGRHEEAYEAGQRVLAADPEHGEAHFNLGLAGMRTNRYEAALEHFRFVLARDPNNVRALTNLGGVYFGLGFIQDSLAQYRAALEIDPTLVGIWQNYLSILNYDEECPLDRMMAEHRRVGERIQSMAGPRPAGYVNDPSPERRLRIGYLSGDLIMHPASHYLEPVFRLHDKNAFDLYAYSLCTWSDPVTDAFRQFIPNWREAGALDDNQVFDLIQADQIDILIDLSGHTARNRILALTRKPAPITANWIGYLNTIGAPSVDYALLDPHLLSPAAAAGFVEKPWTLPETAYCYAPLAAPRQATPSPWLRNGYITFGCFNNPAKLSQAAFAAWSEIVRAVPDSKIIFKYKTFDAPMVQKRVLDAMTGRGVAPERIVFQGHSPLGAFLDGFADIDVALDTFPYTGVTTTMHTLWVGVPMATVSGDTPMQRFGRSALINIGRPDWVAGNATEYPGVVLRIVEEIKRNPRLRADVRRRMLTSPLMRHEPYVRALEQGYRDMWRRWCASRAA